jgi:transposase
MTVMITRLDQDASDMRVAAARSADAKVARRLLALALVLEGHSRAEAAQSCGMDRQTLRDWVHRYNEHGIAGLSNQPHAGGSTPKFMPQEKQEVARWVRQGPDPKQDGVVRWRLTDLKRRILDRFFVVLDERSVSRLLKSMKFTHVSVRPRNPKADAEAQEAHKKTSPIWLPRQSHPRPVTSRSNSGGRMRPGSASKAV